MLAVNEAARAVATAALVTALAAAGCREESARPDETEAFDAAGAAADADAAVSDAAAADAAPAHVPCPAAPGAREDPDALIELALRLYGDGEHAGAVTCADLAEELVPVAVEAHQVEAMSLAAMGRHAAAREAFAMALALDPNDPDTLAAAARYYIDGNGDRDGERRGDTARLGLEYARRGTAHVRDRWRQGDPVEGELFVLEAQALNDLGRPDEALETAERALELEEPPAEASYERAVSLFLLSRFDGARAAFESLLETGEAPSRAAYAHWHLGLIRERGGDSDAARAAFERAAELSDGELAAPLEVSEEAFRAELDAAIAALPDEERAALSGVPVEVADLPADGDLLAVDPPLPPTILGLFRGLSHGERAPDADAGAPPDRAVVLYRKNLARVADDRDDLSRQIRETLLHEIGHLRGLGESDLRRRGLE